MCVCVRIHIQIIQSQINHICTKTHHMEVSLKIEVPLVTIHFCGSFHEINHLFWGNPHLWKPHETPHMSSLRGWMVFVEKIPLKLRWFRGTPILGNPHMIVSSNVVPVVTGSTKPHIYHKWSCNSCFKTKQVTGTTSTNSACIVDISPMMSH